MGAVLVLGMQNDVIYAKIPHVSLPAEHGEKIIPNVQRILNVARKGKYPIIYTCLQCYPEDPSFKMAKMTPHVIVGTKGAEVIAALKPEPGDYTVYIPRMDSFFGSNLDFILKEVLGAKEVIITGITTGIGCFLTAMGAIQRGLNAILVTDACATYTEERQNIALEFFRKNAGFIRLITTDEVIGELSSPR